MADFATFITVHCNFPTIRDITRKDGIKAFYFDKALN
jgi:hypothetical protein